MQFKSVASVLISVSLSASVVAALQWDKKTIEKMLSDGAKKLASPKTEDRQDGAGYILGYITCDYRKQYQPVLVKALKDTDPKVRQTAVQALERIQAVDAIPDIVTLLDDPVDDVRERAAYALGGLGKAGKSAEPALRAALAKAKVQKKSMVEGAMENALNEISGKSKPDRYSCP